MEELIHRIEQVASETEFSGVISIFKDSSTLYTKAYGYRDIKNHLPNTTSTVFGIASGTKFFTALGIGVLIDRAGLREPTHDLHTFPSWRPIRNIDHILVSPSLRVEDVSVLNYPLSDHLPISMEISLPDELEMSSRHHANWDRNPLVTAQL